MRRTVENPTREQAVAYLKAQNKPFEEKEILFVMKHMSLHYFPIYESPKEEVHPITGMKDLGGRVNNIVIVVSTDNYVNGELVPFKAEIIKEYEYETIVKSLVTGREYELYDSQIFEYLSIKEISNMIDISKYGEFCNE